jgi:exportin-1
VKIICLFSKLSGIKYSWPFSLPLIPLFCHANIIIINSEEIFDFSAEQMTQQKTKNLKNTMCGEFSEIFQLCQEVLDKATKPSLIKSTLETLLRFLNWIPLGYIFETNLIEILRTRFLEVPAFKNITLKCLTEIGGLQCGIEYNEKFVIMFNMVMGGINNILPLQTGKYFF